MCEKKESNSLEPEGNRDAKGNYWAKTEIDDLSQKMSWWGGGFLPEQLIEGSSLQARSSYEMIELDINKERAKTHFELNKNSYQE
jgi:hypothetical protein